MSEERPDAAAAPESEATLADMTGKPAPEKVTYSMSGVTRPMSLSFASNEILGLITHDPLAET